MLILVPKYLRFLTNQTLYITLFMVSFPFVLQNASSCNINISSSQYAMYAKRNANIAQQYILDNIEIESSTSDLAPFPLQGLVRL